MNLEIITKRKPSPAPWSECDNIPWNDPEFSRRMLEVHLSQDHDMASRRSVKIDGQTDWIHTKLLKGKPSHILDLACGPGFYSHRLTERGHTCRGIDFSPASIEYAREQARTRKLDCEFVLDDIRSAEYGSGYDLVMLIYGEFNVFKPADISNILDKIRAALNPGGILLLEPHKYEAIHRLAQTKPQWQTADSGLFADGPHIWMSECFWDADSQTGTIRYFVIESGRDKITTFSASYQACNTEQYTDILSSHGFRDIEFYPHLPGYDQEPTEDLIALTCRI